MQNIGVPTASFRTFRHYWDALDFTGFNPLPIVIKASGLALGKGAYICWTLLDAKKALDDIMIKKVHGEAGNEVVIEEYLDGPEVSIHAWCDGKTAKLFPAAQDHKPVFDEDKGPNTGGMGTIASVPWFTPELLNEAKLKIVEPIIEELSAMGQPFVGCLFPGLKKTSSGLKVLEFNARPGDPEMQVYMRLLKTDFLEIAEACVNGTLADMKIEWRSDFAACIVLASGGYPDTYVKGLPIFGIEDAEKLPGVVVFHAGTTFANEVFRTNGGRVLGVTATAGTLKEALDRAYFAASLIHFDRMHYRRDIGAKALLLSQGS